MNVNVSRWAALGLSLLAVGCGKGAAFDAFDSPIDISRPTEAWDANNNPSRLRDSYEIRLESLPTAAVLDHKPWTDTYWPNNRGGLAHRWLAGGGSAWSYALQPQAQVATLSENELKRLSPAEKYDIFTGSYDYPLVTYERRRTKPSDASWFGLCHGWAPAGINFTEPKPVTVTGPSGIAMPFGSSDVKALLTMAQQYQRSQRDLRFLGGRCDHDISANPGMANASQCRDVNAGSFHIILTNQIGIEKQAFVADVTRDLQVWNQPVYGFASTVLNPDGPLYASAAAGTVKVVRMRTSMSYILEVGPRWDALPFDEHPQQGVKKTYVYWLELNAAGEIIGGRWEGSDRPDFLWTQTTPAFSGFFANLEAIYRASIGG